MAKYVAGIDLGTCYSCIAYIDETGHPVVMKNMEGDATTPSVVNFASPTEVVVGQNAKDNAVIEPEKTVLLVKTLMGKEGAVAITYDGKDRSPEEVSSYILRKVVGDGSKMLGEEITDVVITCPAYFGDAERTATKHAGEIAGLNVMEIISEPTAAAFYYGVTKSAEPQTVLVYDLGGGTFDVTVLKITEDTIEVVCSDGDHDLGGKNWDELIMKHFADEFKVATGYEKDFDEYARQSLAISAEKAKKQLSSREAIPVVLDIDGLRCRIEFTRKKFDELTNTYLQETIDLTRKCMELAESKGEKIDQILLVGGSTKMPQVSRAIEEAFGIDTRPLDPDEAVAKGAAIYAFEKYVQKQEEEKTTSEKTEETDHDYSEPLVGQDKIMATLGGNGAKKIVGATTKSYAVEAYQGDKKCCCNLIKKNQAMPDGALSGSRLFGIHEDGQITVDLVVYESDTMDEFFELNPENILGTAVLQLPTDENGRGILSAMSPIEVTFILNQEGILTVKGVDKTNGCEVEVKMEAKGVMSAAEVEKLKSDSHDIDIF